MTNLRRRPEMRREESPLWIGEEHVVVHST